MKIGHIAVWTRDLERMREFYERYFSGTAGEIYTNSKKGFSSYFINFDDGAALELMHRTDVAADPEQGCERCGITHIAFCAGEREQVDALTERLRGDGYTVLGEPRTTGDGFYESVVADPEGNRLEIIDAP